MCFDCFNINSVCIVSGTVFLIFVLRQDLATYFRLALNWLHRPSWTQTLVILLPPPSKCWGHQHAPPLPALVLLRLQKIHCLYPPHGSLDPEKFPGAPAVCPQPGCMPVCPSALCTGWERPWAGRWLSCLHGGWSEVDVDVFFRQRIRCTEEGQLSLSAVVCQVSWR